MNKSLQHLVLLQNHSLISHRRLHLSVPLCFHFLKKQTAIDPEIAKIREERKRRKLEKAILKLKQYGKKPKPVEEIGIDIKLINTLDNRRREPDPINEENEMKRIVILKEYARSRVLLANENIRWIKDAMRRQIRALEALKIVSPELYKAAVKSEQCGLPSIMEGPSLTPPIEGYKSPDGDYKDVTKQWVQPELPPLIKKFGVGRLIKTPTFQKKLLEQKKNQEGENKKEEGPKKKTATA
ncbi:hypothetical protein ACQ4LE_010197 [Meloidogyne hapla]|uniref:Large ribosomal subunit protein mL40 n=1 Tax=Meloidogyne hapla TaxID=6305 RepID=A0A1I8B0U6_MELHA